MQNLIPFIHPAMMWDSVDWYFHVGHLGWQSRRIRFVKAEQRKELIQIHVDAKHTKIASLLLGPLVIGGGHRHNCILVYSSAAYTAKLGRY